MLCRDVMLTLVYRCTEETSVSACARLMREKNIGFVPVVNGEEKLVGLCTDRDLTIRVLADELPPNTPLREVMSYGPIITCTPDDDLHALEDKLAATKKSRAVVLDKAGAIVGVISLSDIAVSEASTLRTGRLLREVARRESVSVTHS